MHRAGITWDAKDMNPPSLPTARTHGGQARVANQTRAIGLTE